MQPHFAADAMSDSRRTDFIPSDRSGDRRDLRMIVDQTGSTKSVCKDF